MNLSLGTTQVLPYFSELQTHYNSYSYKFYCRYYIIQFPDIIQWKLAKNPMRMEFKRENLDQI